MEGMRHCSDTGAPPDTQAGHERYSALQDFALGLARQMHLSLVLYLQRAGTSAPPQLFLKLGGPEQGWHVACGTLEEAARQLHALGMHYWATRRRQAPSARRGIDAGATGRPARWAGIDERGWERYAYDRS